MKEEKYEGKVRRGQLEGRGASFNLVQMDGSRFVVEFSSRSRIEGSVPNRVDFKAYTSEKQMRIREDKVSNTMWLI